jgi:hypothetical protein
MKTTVRFHPLLAAKRFFLQAAFADINIGKGWSVYYVKQGTVTVGIWTKAGGVSACCP